MARLGQGFEIVPCEQERQVAKMRALVMNDRGRTQATTLAERELREVRTTQLAPRTEVVTARRSLDDMARDR